MIKSGEKKEEYREIKSYYTSRLYGRAYEHNVKNGFVKEHSIEKEILLRNGYSSNSPTIKCKVIIEKGYGKEEWGAEPNKKYYVLKILSVEKIDD
jgi:hypothetical protein